MTIIGIYLLIIIITSFLVISFTLAKIGKIRSIYAHTAIFDIVHLYSLAEFIKFQVFPIF